jgi:hypothetical protein
MAGLILLMAEAKVGLLYSMPMNPVIRYVDIQKLKKNKKCSWLYPSSPRTPILQRIERLSEGSDLDLQKNAQVIK